MRVWAAAVVAVLLVALPLAGQESDLEVPSLTLSGFVNASVFAQDRSFGYGDGQNAVWARSGRGGSDRWFVGGDVRNTRMRLTLDEEVDGRSSVRAVVEADFFGGFNGAGPYSDEQPQPRLRLAYVDLRLGGTLLRVGQMFTPLMGGVPASLSHLAFPLGLGSAGVIGWRHPGLLVERRLGSGAGLDLSVQAGAFRGSWSGPGEAAALPQLEARLDVRHRVPDGVTWSGYLVGHYDRKDVEGTTPDSPAEGAVEGVGVQAGGTVARGPFTVLGNAYWGRALGHQFGQLGQLGDIAGWGGWGQAQVRLSSHWDLAFFMGQDDPRDGDVRREVVGQRRLQNRTTAAMARFALGPYALALESVRARTLWTEEGPEPGEEWTSSARQVILSVLYRF